MSRRKVSHKRRPGRPRGDASGQRELLLDAALACYARHGITASSVRSIATEAGVTPALFNYYFGSKESLLEAVVEERLLPVISQMRQAIESAGTDPRAVATEFVQGVHAAVARHPWLPSLWVREILSEGGALRDLLLDQLPPHVPRMLTERFAAAARSGELSGELDPRLLVVSLVGLTLFPLAAAPIWRQLFDADDVDADALMYHTLALLDRGIGGLA
ncbi:MAG: TetR/AcrR family transcriptional regulator [Gammaproteobacteria bacterium]|nr:TetR/AcrR family transcriptional regulator [Gammaproteobacteria bacterium]